MDGIMDVDGEKGTSGSGGGSGGAVLVEAGKIV